MLEAEPLSDDILRAVPATATVAGVSRFDAARLVDEIHDAIQKVDENAAAQLDQGIEQAGAMLGMDLRKDFLGAFGDEWAYYTDPNTGGRGAMGFVLVNRLRDGKKAEAALDKIVDLANGLIAREGPDAKIKVSLREAKVGDVTVRYVATPNLTKHRFAQTRHSEGTPEEADSSSETENRGLRNTSDPASDVAEL